MQTFLPYPDFQKSLACLDPKRLGNQVWRECMTLIRGGWKNHPCSKMWRGYKGVLINYTLLGLEELRYPTHKDRLLPSDFFVNETYPRMLKELNERLESLQNELEMPHWLGDARLHSSHRSALLFKRWEWYYKFEWIEKPSILNSEGKIEYYWPEGRKNYE
jgi:hypothetical protein